MTEMKIKAIAPYFGGKRNLAPTIVKLLGSHNSYWEPFCGSMAVLFAKKPCTMETVNDLHGDLINLARVLQDEDMAVELYGKLNRVLMHEKLFHEAAARYKERGYYADCSVPVVERACDYMLCAWCGRNGVAGTHSYNQGYSIRYTRNGGHAAKRWLSVVESIPAWHERLRQVTILCRDPPYLVKGAKYIHDFADGDHERLAALLKRFKQSRVVVSYYDHPKLDELYPDWQRHEINVSKAMSNAGSRGEKDVRATEVLLVNENESAGLF
jgi:DNA adenine methylase